ncbi:MAG: hypothetical protein HN936_15155 [Bacteroidetes bacterium]|nr:hypothetical protein [Bacteroidota bacterium]MBT7094585.1 hypothetical protein [Bacteroidota bacterium]MBT7462696.1 hypothetical protein [Bacteroidota bacterium]
MMIKYYMSIIFGLLILGASPKLALAQDKDSIVHFDYHKLKPIVQVFGTAVYNVDEDHYAYGFGRAHLGFQYSFNDKWSSKIIIDRGRPSIVGQILVADSTGNLLSVENSSMEGAYYTMFLKFANLHWDINQKLSIEGGAILQNHYITQERFWGLRYVAQTFQDLYWKIPSSDLGFIARLKINRYFSVDATVTNGEGPRINQDKFGKLKYSAGIDFNPGNKIQTRIYYHNQQTGDPEAATEQLLSLFAGIKPNDKIRIGGEFNYINNLHSINGQNNYGYSLYGAWCFISNTELFCRYDQLKFKETNDSSLLNLDNGSSIIVGFSYAPVKGVHMSLNYQVWLQEMSDKENQNRILLSMEYNL